MASPRSPESPAPGTTAAPTVALTGGPGQQAVDALLAALRARLAGQGPAVRPLAPQHPAPAGGSGEPVVPPEVAVVLSTSGSTTGSGQQVLLDREAVLASARATHERLGGPGQWLAALPAHHVAGLQVLLRSAVAGTAPVVLDTAGGFHPEALPTAVRSLRADLPRYVSLVPTQLARTMAAGEEAIGALRTFQAVLVGGSSTPAPLLTRAREAGVAVVTTYGMTETSGGCVYDGVPLPGVSAEVDDEGRVWLAGPVLARGYLADPAATTRTFVTRAGRRWLRTADHGTWSGGTLRVLGRLDDVIVTGGLNVSAGAVERALEELDDVGEAVVVGVRDAEWGALVTVVTAGTPPPLDRLREHVGARLGRAQAPRAVVGLAALPLRGPGKVDRRAAAELAGDRLAAGAPEAERLP